MSFVRAVRLRVPAGAAKPGPSIGQSLGPLGVNMAQFCKDFNDQSEVLYEKETPLRVELRAMSDRSYTLRIRSPPTAWLIKQASGLGSKKGPQEPNALLDPVAFLTPENVHEIAVIKQSDDNRWHIPLEGIAQSVIGTARSMGIQVREEQADGNDKENDGDDDNNDVADDEAKEENPKAK